MTPGCSSVEGLVQPGISTAEHMQWVVRVDPESVVVRVLVAPSLQITERLPAVVRDLEEDVHLDHDVGFSRRSLDLLVVVGSRTT